jgi:hypothetical protein
MWANIKKPFCRWRFKKEMEPRLGSIGGMKMTKRVEDISNFPSGMIVEVSK